MYGGSLQLDGLEDGHWRYGAGGTRPLYLFQDGIGTLVLPFKGQSCTGGMMACDAARLCIVRIVVADDEAIDGKGILAGGDFLGEDG